MKKIRYNLIKKYKNLVDYEDNNRFIEKSIKEYTSESNLFI